MNAPTTEGDATHAQAALPAKQSGSRRGLIIVFVLIAVAVVGLFAVRVVQAAAKKKAAANAIVDAPPLAVKTVAVASAQVPDVITVTGAVRPKEEVDVFTKVAGRIQSVTVDLGSPVKAGQVIAVVEARELALQQQQGAAQADAARASLEAATANEESARVQLDRYRGLKAQNAVPQAEFERIESAYKSAATGVKSAQAQLAVAEAASALQGTQLGNSRITAPISGIISKRNVDLGTQVSPSQALFQIQDTTSLTVEGSVPGREAVRIAPGAVADVTAEEAPNTHVAAKVLRVSPSLDPVTRRALVKVEVTDKRDAKDTNPDRLLPNMFATAHITIGGERTALVIPQSAVVTLATGAVVFAVRDGKAVEVRPDLGDVVGTNVIVESGLAAGDVVIVSGDAGLRNGVRVAADQGDKPQTAEKAGDK